MGTLKQLKTKMKLDCNWHRTLLRGSKDEILIDLDGDREADLALLDTTGSGEIDFLAIDLTGGGEFNLYIGDTDENGIPDLVLYDENADNDLERLGLGKELAYDLIAAASLVRSAVITGDYILDTLEEKLDALDKQIKLAQKELREGSAYRT